MAQPVEGTISQVDEIQDQMRNQERLLAQLHESILEQDKQLLGREAEAQSYASKLKKLQSRHLHDQKGHETATQAKLPTQETSGLSEQKSQTSRPSGSLTLLRQKVEENRLKVAQRGRQEQESKRELEEKVTALKSQLEEIQKASATTSPLPEQNPVDMQMVALEEQIQAKDSLIEARTRAITLLTEDFSRKRKEVVDQLDETREEMRRMQENFIATEDSYKAEIQARDKRLFEMDSKLRTLNAKLEQTEELSIVLADKENLQKQVNDLIVIRNEKESLEEKIKELLNIQHMYQQKEAEVSIILGEKLKLEAELAEINRKREEESSSYLKKMQNFQKKVEKLSKQLALNENKMKDMSAVINTCQANEEMLISLSLEKQILEEKVGTLTRLVDSQQQIQVETSTETSTLIDSSPHHDNEMTLLLEEKQSLKQKLNSAIEYFSVPQRDLKRPSVKKQDHTKKLQEIVELTKMLLANDEKIKDFEQQLHSNKSAYTVSEPVVEKVELEEKVNQLSDLLDIYRQTIKDLYTFKEDGDINLITQSIETRDNINIADKEELCSLIERNKQSMNKLESLMTALNESQQELQQQAVLMNECQFNQTELQNELDGYQKKCKKILQENEQLGVKVDELGKLLKAIHHIHSEEMVALREEKHDLMNKIDNLSKHLHDIGHMLQFKDDTKQELSSQETALLKEKQMLGKKLRELTPLFQIIGDRLDSLSDCHHQQEVQLSSFLEGRHELADVSHESIYQLHLLQQQHSEELLMFLQDKRRLQEKVDELSNLVAAKKQYLQFSEEMSTLLQEKQKLEMEVDELSMLVSAKEQNMQGLNDQLTASKEQYGGEFSTLLQEKEQLGMKVDELSMLVAAKEQNIQGLGMKVDELSMLVAAKEQNIQGLSDQLTANKEQFSRELSIVLQEKQQLEVNVNELSMLVADKEQNMQELSDHFSASKEQLSGELSTLMQEKQQLEIKLNELAYFVAASEQNMQGLSDQLTVREKQVNEEMSTLLQEKQQLEMKVDELSILVAGKEQNIQGLSDQLAANKDQYGGELSTLLQEKQQLEMKVDELSKLVAANEQNIQELNDQLAVRKKQFNEEMSALLQEKQLLELEAHKLSMLVATKEQNMQSLTDQLTTSKEQYNSELLTLLQEKERLEVKVDELSNLVAAKEQNMQNLNDQLIASKEQHSKEMDWLLKESEQREENTVEMLNLLNSKKQAVEELKVEINNIQQLHNKELSSVFEEKQALQNTVTENLTVISILEQTVQSLSEQLNTLQLQNEEFSILLKEKEELQGKVRELSALVVSHEQNLQVLKDHLKSSQQQHLKVKQELENEVNRLSSVITLNENNLQALMDRITTNERDLSARIEEKQQLEEKCMEYCNLLEASEQRLVAMKHANEEKEELLAHLQAKQREHEHITNEGYEHITNESYTHLVEEQSMQKKVPLSTHMPMTRETLQGASDSQYHQNEWSTVLAEKQLLEQHVQELFFYLKQHVQGLKELKDNGNEQIRTQLADSLDEKSYDQVDLQSLFAEYKANLEQLKKQMLYTSTLSQEKQNLEEHLKDIQRQFNCQIEEKTKSLTIMMQEKAALECQVDEVSRLLKTAEEREEKIYHENANLTEQLNFLMKENVSNVTINDLQNRIAELEEEKGNLQLHLVDFEELKAEGADLVAEVESLRSQKVAAEMKGVELEEELDLLKREDNTALINSLNTQLKGQMDTCNRLTETLMERDTMLGDTEKKYGFMLQQSQDQISRLEALVETKATEVLNYKERLAHVQASLDEVLHTNNCVKRNIEKFCSDIVHGSFGEYLSQIQGMSDDSLDGLGEVKFLKSEEELSSVLSAARSILVEKESLLHSLKAEISKAHDQTSSYENTLHELEFFRRENDLLQTRVNEFQSMTNEKQKEIQEVMGLKEGQEKRNRADEAFQNQLKQLEQEKERLTEEMKAAQVRSGKLVKKIKSLKADYDLLAAENLKLSNAVSSGPNIEQDNRIASLQQEVLKLQAELEKKVKKMDEASTQANDDHLAWLNNEYENVKHEVQHLIEEIEYKDAKSLQLTEQLQSKDNTIKELAKTVESLTESLQEREQKLVQFQTLQDHNGKDAHFPSKDVESHRMELDHVLRMLREKEDEVAHLEELLQQRVHGESGDETIHKEIDEPVLKQLDDALYMLHQKEVRCDELTLELMQLLEERDTLQLRLSTTIRQYEELRASCSHPQEKCVQSTSSSPALSNKLEEVRNVGREQRSMALQQRADTTVSRDNLSQSETLINWIRGRTTPKVMHI